MPFFVAIKNPIFKQGGGILFANNSDGETEIDFTFA